MPLNSTLTTTRRQFDAFKAKSACNQLKVESRKERFDWILIEE